MPKSSQDFQFSCSNFSYTELKIVAGESIAKQVEHFFKVTYTVKLRTIDRKALSDYFLQKELSVWRVSNEKPTIQFDRVVQQ